LRERKFNKFNYDIAYFSLAVVLYLKKVIEGNLVFSSISFSELKQMKMHVIV